MAADRNQEDNTGQTVLLILVIVAESCGGKVWRHSFSRVPQLRDITNAAKSCGIYQLVVI